MAPRGRHPHHRLTDLTIHRAKPGRHADGNGLYLFVRETGSCAWVQRLVINGRRRDLGLGSYHLVPLAEARQCALDNRRLARKGQDPTTPQRQDSTPMVCAAVEAVLASRRANWRDESTEKKWRRMFETLVFPLRMQQRRARMALAPLTDQCMPARLRLAPTACLQPASTTPVATHRPLV